MRPNGNGTILKGCEEVADGGISNTNTKQDRVRLREELAKETNERLLRELNRVNSYKSEEAEEFSAILGWIIGSIVAAPPAKISPKPLSHSDYQRWLWEC